MKSEYQEYQKKCNRFNQWEDRKREELPLINRAQQFLILFELSHFYNADEIQKYQNQHLQALIKTMRELRMAKKEKREKGEANKPPSSPRAAMTEKTAYPNNELMETGRRNQETGKSKKIERFEDLEVWQKSLRLSQLIYQELKNYKDYGLRNKQCYLV